MIISATMLPNAFVFLLLPGFHLYNIKKVGKEESEVKERRKKEKVEITMLG